MAIATGIVAMLAIIIVGTVGSIVLSGHLGTKLIQKTMKERYRPGIGQKIKLPNGFGASGVVMVAIVGPLLSIWLGVTALLSVVGG